MNRILIVIGLAASLAACGSKDDTADSGGDTDMTGTGTGAATGTGATGTGTGATGTGTGATGTGTGATGTGTGGTSGGPYDLNFTLSGYDPHNDQTLWIAVTDAAYIEVASLETTVTGGMVDETFPGILLENETYAVWWAVDVDGDGACDVAAGDHAWSLPIAAVMGDVTVAETHNTNFDANTCGFVP